VYQELLHNKYLKHETQSQVTAKPTDSQFWKKLMGVKDEFFSRGSFSLGNGFKTRFWEDTWLGDTPLTNKYPSLYNIVQRKNDLVANILTGSHLNIEFRRVMSGHRLEFGIQLVRSLIRVNLTTKEDRVIWNLSPSGSLT
jgi:hypothetical protein